MTEIDLVLEELELEPTSQVARERVLNLAKKRPDVSELVRKIMERCTSELDKRGSWQAGGITFDFSTGRSRRGYSVQLGKPIRHLGKLHSEHLYLAAECIGQAKVIDKKMVDMVIDCLLSEFDLEVFFPRAAINAFGAMGEKAIPRLIEYIKDRQKETFSREDAALALGAIGTDRVVRELSDWLFRADYEDMAMPLYALGKTRNLKARKPILDFLKSYPVHPKIWVAKNALGEVPS